MSGLSCLVFRDLHPACAVEEAHVLRVLSRGEWGTAAGLVDGLGRADEGEAQGEPLSVEVLGVHGPGSGDPSSGDPSSGAADGKAGSSATRVLMLRTEHGALALVVPGTLTFEHFDAERFAPLVGRAFDASVFSGVITRGESIDVFLLDPNRLIGSLAP